MGGARVGRFKAAGQHRCTMAEFMEYTWKENNPGDIRPKVVGRLWPKEIINVDTGAFMGLEELGVDIAITRTIDFKDKQTRTNLRGMHDAERTVKGTSNFFEGIPVVGRRIALASAYLDDPDASRLFTDDERTAAGKLLQNARDTMAVMVDFRLMDMEERRIGGMSQRLGVPVVTKDGPNTLGIVNRILRRASGSYQTIDRQGTIDKYIATIPTIAQDFDSHMVAWEADPARNFGNRWHNVAIQVCRDAARTCDCLLGPNNELPPWSGLPAR